MALQREGAEAIASRTRRQLCPILVESINSRGGSTLFERLFRRKSIIRRHQEAPFAEERSGYLAFKAEGGAARITLCATANYLLAVASCIALKDPTPISRETIATAASRWARSVPRGQTATVRDREHDTRVAAASKPTLRNVRCCRGDL